MEGAAYVISLDAMDFNLMKSTYKPKYSKVVPLWTKSNLEFRNDEYYEFEIKTINDKKLEDEEENVEFEYTTCHICDIEVPKLFLNDHERSFRHETNIKIVDVVLKRLKRFTNQSKKYEETNTYSSVYFCTTCCTVIKLVDKNCHEKSISHQNSLRVDKYLNDFYLSYANFNKEKDEPDVEQSVIDNFTSNLSLLNDNVDITKQKYIDNTLNEEDNKYIHPVLYKNEHEYETGDVDGIVKDNKKNNSQFNIIDQNNNKREMEKINNIKETIETQTKKCNEAEPSKEIEYHETVKEEPKEIIQELKTDLNTVKFNKKCHYHIEMLVGSKALLCKVCKLHITNSKKNINDHLKGHKHMEKYRIMLNDNYLRKRQNQFFCDVCSITFAIGEEFLHCKDLNHITNCLRHTNNIYSCLEKEYSSKNECQISEIEKEGCFIENKRAKVSISNSHMKNVNSITNNVELTEIDYHLNITENPKILKCLVCNVDVPYSSKNMQAHINGANHKRTNNQLLLQNCIEPRENGFECTLCKIFLPQSTELQHIQVNPHKSYMELKNGLRELLNEFRQYCSLSKNVLQKQSYS